MVPTICLHMSRLIRRARYYYPEPLQGHLRRIVVACIPWCHELKLAPLVMRHKKKAASILHKKNKKKNGKKS